jgi:hypothetical protein
VVKAELDSFHILIEEMAEILITVISLVQSVFFSLYPSISAPLLLSKKVQ